MSNILPYPLILASASPRRRQFLRDAGYDFEVVPPPIEEPAEPPVGIESAVWVETLAYLKARSVFELHPNALVIGADTVVTYENQIIGKPADLAHARRILTTQFGGKNDVITGLAVLHPGRFGCIITHVTTTLIMRPMTATELEEYLAGGAWRGKAGAYALQEGGDKFVQAAHGSESNVVGLPMEKLREILSLINHDQKQTS
jgi:septum formation protein